MGINVTILLKEISFLIDLHRKPIMWDSNEYNIEVSYGHKSKREAVNLSYTGHAIVTLN